MLGNDFMSAHAVEEEVGSELRGSATLTSSACYLDNVVENIVDDNLGTLFVDDGHSRTAWVKFDWSSPVTIREIRLRSVNGWGRPVFTFSDDTYTKGYVLCGASGDCTYVLLHPKTTSSLKIGINSSNWSPVGGSGWPDLSEVNISSAYTVAPSTDLTQPDHLIPSSFYPEASSGPWWAIDGNSATGWCTNNEGGTAYLLFEYNSAVRVDEVKIKAAGWVEWGIPRFVFDDATYQDGSEMPSMAGFTTYTLTPKTTTSLKIFRVPSTGGTSWQGLVDVVITGSV